MKKGFSNGFYVRCCLLVIVLLTIVAEYVVSQKFKIEFTGHLERAANTNVMETALGELNICVRYLEQHNMTTGFTSTVWNTPDEDVAYFYDNLSKTFSDLNLTNTVGTPLEKSNALLKLKEGLIYNDGKHGDKLIYPEDLQYFQNKYTWFACSTISFLFFIYLLLYGWYWSVKKS